MAHAAQSSSASLGGRRSLDAEVNLVPFIDLLSMCICFLLMTAVWAQVVAMQVKQSHGTATLQTNNESAEMDVQFLSATKLSFKVKQKGTTVKGLTISGKSPADLITQFEKNLPIFLSGLGKVRISSAMVTPRQGVTYGNLVSVMDELRKRQIVNLGIVPL